MNNQDRDGGEVDKSSKHNNTQLLEKDSKTHEYVKEGLVSYLLWYQFISQKEEEEEKKKKYNCKYN